jgi:uncharacterized protein YcnI
MRFFMNGLKMALAALAALAATPAFSHITLLNREAHVGTSYMAVFRVPHGCAGSATTAIRVRMPAGVVTAKPQPKPGWTIEIKRARFDEPVADKGAKVLEGVTEISWSGGKLPDEYYDEFAVQVGLADSLQPGKTLYFPVVQECEKGIDRWIEIPAAGKKTDDYKSPAPGVLLTPR